MLIDHYFSGGDIGKYGPPAIPKKQEATPWGGLFYGLGASMVRGDSGRLGQGYLVTLFYPQLFQGNRDHAGDDGTADHAEQC